MHNYHTRSGLRLSFVTAAILALASCAPVAAPAQTARTWCDPEEVGNLRSRYKLGAEFTEDMLIAAIARQKNEESERTLHLKPNWTREQYAQAEAALKVADIRRRYGLQPGFTADDWATVSAQSQLADFLEEKGVHAGFSEADLRLQLSDSELQYRPRWFEGAPKPVNWPLGYDDLVAWAGPAIADQLSKKYQLPQPWTYADLRDGAGPEDAARLASWHNLNGGMSHAEIIKAIGLALAKRVATARHLPEHFSVGDLITASGNFAVSQIRLQFQFPEELELNESNFKAVAKRRTLLWLAAEYKTLPPNFTEADLLRKLADETGERERRKYDLRVDFVEHDWGTAVAQSEVAKLRLAYSLPRHFQERDLVRVIDEKMKHDDCP